MYILSQTPQDNAHTGRRQEMKMDRATYKAAQHARRTLHRYFKEVGLNPVAGCLVSRSHMQWLQAQFMPVCERVTEVEGFCPMGRVLNWREAYLLHDRRGDVLEQFRNRRWFRSPSPIARFRALEAA